MFSPAESVVSPSQPDPRRRHADAPDQHRLAGGHGFARRPARGRHLVQHLPEIPARQDLRESAHGGRNAMHIALLQLAMASREATLF